MAYFLNTNVPDNKNIEIALTYVYGIGRKESINVCRKLGVNPKKKNLKI
jgi:small subunit ribosomal protein S13